MTKGKVIVIEGTDGAGKGTQLNLLIDHFKKNNVSFAPYDFPQYEKTFFGNFVGRFLNGEFGHISRINPYLAMFPYAGDRWQSKEAMEKDLKKGKIIVCNRYTPSVAYQVVKVKPSKREQFLTWASTLEHEIFKIPKPDLVIFLYMPLHIAQTLIEKKDKRTYLKNGKLKDQYEENMKYLEKVEKVYLWMAKKNKKWTRINCVDSKGVIKTREQIFSEICEVLKKKKITH